MSVAFMTEAEAEAIINEKMDELMSKLVCSTQCTESGASIGLIGQCDDLQCPPEPEGGVCCGCCAV